MKKILCLMLCCALCAMPCLAEGTALNVQAPSALLMHPSGKVLFEKDPHKQLEPASVTKVMTLLLIMEAVDSGKSS